MLYCPVRGAEPTSARVRFSVLLHRASSLDGGHDVEAQKMTAIGLVVADHWSSLIFYARILKPDLLLRNDEIQLRRSCRFLGAGSWSILGCLDTVYNIEMGFEATHPVFGKIAFDDSGEEWKVTV